MGLQNSELKPENLKEVYDKLAFKVWSKQKPEKTWGFEEVKKFAHFVEKGKALDLGCAIGNHSKVLIDLGLEVVGIDFAKKMIEEARKKVPNAEFLVMDILNLDFPAEHFDGVYARASLLHIPKNKIRQVLKDLHKIIKRNGIIYVALKEGEGERDVFDEDKRVKRFFAFYREDEFKKLLEEEKFKLIETVYAQTERSRWLQFFAKKV